MIPGVPFESSEVRLDKDGRWVILKERLNGEEIVIGFETFSDCLYFIDL